MRNPSRNRSVVFRARMALKEVRGELTVAKTASHHAARATGWECLQMENAAETPHGNATSNDERGRIPDLHETVGEFTVLQRCVISYPNPSAVKC